MYLQLTSIYVMAQKNMSLIHSHRHIYGHFLVCPENSIPDLRMLEPIMLISIGLLAFFTTQRNIPLSCAHTDYL